MPCSATLGRNLRTAFPGLTIARLDQIWDWVVAMPRGQVMLPDTDLVNPDELVAALHLARHLEHRNTEQLQKLVKNLSAHGKRWRFPKSYAEEDA